MGGKGRARGGGDRHSRRETVEEIDEALQLPARRLCRRRPEPPTPRPTRACGGTGRGWWWGVGRGRGRGRSPGCVGACMRASSHRCEPQARAPGEGNERAPSIISWAHSDPATLAAAAGVAPSRCTMKSRSRARSAEVSPALANACSSSAENSRSTATAARTNIAVTKRRAASEMAWRMKLCHARVRRVGASASQVAAL